MESESKPTDGSPLASSGGSAKSNFEVNYYNTSSGEKVWSHKYVEEWETLPSLYCPNCGKREVWHNTGGGDYYVEEEYMCAACGNSWYMPGGIHDQKADEQGRQRLAHISPNDQALPQPTGGNGGAEMKA